MKKRAKWLLSISSGVAVTASLASVTACAATPDSDSAHTAIPDIKPNPTPPTDITLSDLTLTNGTLPREVLVKLFPEVANLNDDQFKGILVKITGTPSAGTPVTITIELRNGYTWQQGKPPVTTSITITPIANPSTSQVIPSLVAKSAENLPKDITLAQLTGNNTRLEKSVISKLYDGAEKLTDDHIKNIIVKYDVEPVVGKSLTITLIAEDGWEWENDKAPEPVTITPIANPSSTIYMPKAINPKTTLPTNMEVKDLTLINNTLPQETLAKVFDGIEGLENELYKTINVDFYGKTPTAGQPLKIRLTLDEGCAWFNNTPPTIPTITPMTLVNVPLVNTTAPTNVQVIELIPTNGRLKTSTMSKIYSNISSFSEEQLNAMTATINPANPKAGQSTTITLGLKNGYQWNGNAPKVATITPIVVVEPLIARETLPTNIQLSELTLSNKQLTKATLAKIYSNVDELSNEEISALEVALNPTAPVAGSPVTITLSLKAHYQWNGNAPKTVTITPIQNSGQPLVMPNEISAKATQPTDLKVADLTLINNALPQATLAKMFEGIASLPEKFYNAIIVNYEGNATPTEGVSLKVKLTLKNGFQWASSGEPGIATVTPVAGLVTVPLVRESFVGNIKTSELILNAQGNLEVMTMNKIFSNIASFKEEELEAIIATVNPSSPKAGQETTITFSLKAGYHWAGTAPAPVKVTPVVVVSTLTARANLPTDIIPDDLTLNKGTLSDEVMNKIYSDYSSLSADEKSALIVTLNPIAPVAGGKVIISVDLKDHYLWFGGIAPTDVTLTLDYPPTPLKNAITPKENMPENLTYELLTENNGRPSRSTLETIFDGIQTLSVEEYNGLIVNFSQDPVAGEDLVITLGLSDDFTWFKDQAPKTATIIPVAYVRQLQAVSDVPNNMQLHEFTLINGQLGTDTLKKLYSNIGSFTSAELAALRFDINPSVLLAGQETTITPKLTKGYLWANNATPSVLTITPIADAPNIFVMPNAISAKAKLPDKVFTASLTELSGKPSQETLATLFDGISSLTEKQFALINVTYDAAPKTGVEVEIRLSLKDGAAWYHNTAPASVTITPVTLVPQLNIISNADRLSNFSVKEFTFENKALVGKVDYTTLVKLFSNLNQFTKEQVDAITIQISESPEPGKEITVWGTLKPGYLFDGYPPDGIEVRTFIDVPSITSKTTNLPTNLRVSDLTLTNGKLSRNILASLYDGVSALSDTEFNAILVRLSPTTPIAGQNVTISLSLASGHQWTKSAPKSVTIRVLSSDAPVVTLGAAITLKDNPPTQFDITKLVESNGKMNKTTLSTFFTGIDSLTDKEFNALQIIYSTTPTIGEPLTIRLGISPGFAWHASQNGNAPQAFTTKPMYFVPQLTPKNILPTNIMWSEFLLVDGALPKATMLKLYDGLTGVSDVILEGMQVDFSNVPPIAGNSVPVTIFLKDGYTWGSNTAPSKITITLANDASYVAKEVPTTVKPNLGNNYPTNILVSDLVLFNNQLPLNILARMYSGFTGLVDKEIVKSVIVNFDTKPQAGKPLKVTLSLKPNYYWKDNMAPAAITIYPIANIGDDITLTQPIVAKSSSAIKIALEDITFDSVNKLSLDTLKILYSGLDLLRSQELAQISVTMSNSKPVVGSTFTVALSLAKGYTWNGAAPTSVTVLVTANPKRIPALTPVYDPSDIRLKELVLTNLVAGTTNKGKLPKALLSRMFNGINDLTDAQLEAIIVVFPYPPEEGQIFQVELELKEGFAWVGNAKPRPCAFEVKPNITKYKVEVSPKATLPLDLSTYQLTPVAGKLSKATLAKIFDGIDELNDFEFAGINVAISGSATPHIPLTMTLSLGDDYQWMDGTNGSITVRVTPAKIMSYIISYKNLSTENITTRDLTLNSSGQLSQAFLAKHYNGISGLSPQDYERMIITELSGPVKAGTPVTITVKLKPGYLWANNIVPSTMTLTPITPRPSLTLPSITPKNTMPTNIRISELALDQGMMYQFILAQMYEGIAGLNAEQYNGILVSFDSTPTIGRPLIITLKLKDGYYWANGTAPRSVTITPVGNDGPVIGESNKFTFVASSTSKSLTLDSIYNQLAVANEKMILTINNYAEFGKIFGSNALINGVAVDSTSFATLIQNVTFELKALDLTTGKIASINSKDKLKYDERYFISPSVKASSTSWSVTEASYQILIQSAPITLNVENDLMRFNNYYATAENSYSKLTIANFKERIQTAGVDNSILVDVFGNRQGLTVDFEGYSSFDAFANGTYRSPSGQSATSISNGNFADLQNYIAFSLFQRKEDGSLVAITNSNQIQEAMVLVMKPFLKSGITSVNGVTLSQNLKTQIQAAISGQIQFVMLLEGVNSIEVSSKTGTSKPFPWLTEAEMITSQKMAYVPEARDKSRILTLVFSPETLTRLFNIKINGVNITGPVTKEQADLINKYFIFALKDYDYNTYYYKVFKVDETSGNRDHEMVGWSRYDSPYAYGKISTFMWMPIIQSQWGKRGEGKAAQFITTLPRRDEENEHS